MHRALLLVVLVLLGNTAIAQRWYKVEVLVFAQNNASSEEIWAAGLQPHYASQAVPIGQPETSEVADPDAVARGAWQPLSQDDEVLRYMLERMEGTGDYRELYHAAWEQPIGSKAETLPVYVRGGQTLPTEDGEIPELEGTLQFSKSRYLHVTPQIWFNTESNGERLYVDIDEKRRLAGHQVYYFDHALFGMLVRVTRA
ncbi:peptidoglycan binding protein CsiV [Alcanivorax sp. DG881]|jgi:hypothetical protein|uniref:peptidoglycan binding protein CsiV n=1 Tax=Alcanivorax sp. DG881 TaxID=236097 RepID=UPI00017EB980|nr:peptidoglycan binding protein CsiV [Alcanivorax sp. DG881]EDX90549.1 hypothetical protein ADG881_2651 [Alcanivorax sp. DG881]HIL23519.1 hypothetical protein [Alcanivorax sp.]